MNTQKPWCELCREEEAQRKRRREGGGAPFFLIQTEPTPSELLAVADGGRKKITSNMFIIIRACVCVCVYL